MSHIIYYTQLNITCVIILGILLVFLPHAEKADARDKLFSHLIVWGIVNCVTDALAGIFRGQTYAAAEVIVAISNVLYPISIMAYSFLWLLFCTHLLGKKVASPLTIILGIVGIIVCILNAVSLSTGWVFVIDAQNIYHRGPLIVINFIYPYVCQGIAVVMAFFSKAGKREKTSVLLFPLFPLIAATCQLVVYGISAGQIGLTVSLILVFIMLQGRVVDAHILKEKIYNELSTTDELTKLQNRRAYIKKLKDLSDAPWVGISYFDLNNLKKTNDTYGHEAGDKLICNFAKMLDKYYDHEEIFRISGDEFVIVSNNKNHFEAKSVEMQSSLNNIAAMGSCEGSGKDMELLITIAETRMYENKARYHKST